MVKTMIRSTAGSAVRIGLAGAGLMAGVSAAAFAALLAQARRATSRIEADALDGAVADGWITEAERLGLESAVDLPVPFADGCYLPDGTRLETAPQGALVLVMLGDSTSVGYGCREADQVPGSLLARGVAAATSRPVTLVSHGLVGCGAADLDRQVALTLPDSPDVVVINIGANDIRDKVPPWQSAARLGAAVAALRAQRIPVVVGTCPDFGVIEPIPQPLRSVLGSWSRALATLQEREVTAVGARAVSMSKLVSPHFDGHPELFSPDHFHPNAVGYAHAVDALLPAVLTALANDRHGESPVTGGSAPATAEVIAAAPRKTDDAETAA